MSECMTQEDAEKMSNQQAVNILKPLRDMMRDQHGCPISDAYFALDKAINALTAQPEQTQMIKEIRKWINSGNRGSADYFIVDQIEEIINKYE